MRITRLITIFLACTLAILSASAQKKTSEEANRFDYKKLNAQAQKEYLIPVHPGNKERPYWNIHAKKFLYAPVFDFEEVDGAASYKYEVRQGSRQWTFTARTPNSSLSKVWNQIPVGQAEVVCHALDKKGNVIRQAGSRKFMRDFPFHGPYGYSTHGYRDGAIKGMMYIHNMNPIKHWRTHSRPDSTYGHNTYACKIIGSTISIECRLAELVPSMREDAISTARHAADYLMSISQPADSPLAYFPPTYNSDCFDSSQYTYGVMKKNTNMTMFFEAVTAAEGFLDLYELTGDKKYYDQVIRILDTYRRLQANDGSFPIKVYIDSGKSVTDTKGTPSPLLVFVSRLRDGHGIKDYDQMVANAERWMMDNYLETFNFTAQFEDVNVAGVESYQNLTNFTANEYAYYLLSKPSPSTAEIKIAEEIMRFCEDQFVHWEVVPNSEGVTSELAPNVHEQYRFEMPVDHSAGNVGRGFMTLYKTTGENLWLAKAVALANSIVLSQNKKNGKIPTVWDFSPSPNSDFDGGNWINCTLASTSFLMSMSELLED